MFRNPPKPPIPRSILQRLIKVWGVGGGRGGAKRGGQKLEYHDPETGEVYSRRRYEQSSKTGGLTYEEVALRRRVRETKNYETRSSVVYDERFGTLLAHYVKAQQTTKREAIKKDSPFWQALQDLTTRGSSPDTRKARALVLFGLRKPHWRQPIGQSPEPAPVQLTEWEKAHIKATYTPAPAPFSRGVREPVLSTSTRQRRKKGRQHPRHSQ